MDEDARAALNRITTLALNRKIAVAGRFMPEAGVAARLASHGIVKILNNFCPNPGAAGCQER